MNFKTRVIFEIGRPSTSLLAASAPLAAIIATRGLVVADILDIIALSILIVFFFTMASNSLNDYNDYYIDKINKPMKPIPSGRIDRQTVFYFYMSLFIAAYILAIILSYLTNLVVLCIVTLAFFIEYLYETFLKKKKIFGNYIIGIQSALTFIFGGYVIDDVIIPVIIAVAAILCITGREIIKDIEDMMGDQDRTTIPRNYGLKTAWSIAFGLVVISVLIGFIPFIFYGYGFLFLLTLLIADGVLLFSFIKWKSPNQVQKNIKYGMAIAILSFIIGGITYGYF